MTANLNRFERAMEDPRWQTGGAGRFFAAASRSARCQLHQADPRVDALTTVATSVAAQLLTPSGDETSVGGAGACQFRFVHQRPFVADEPLVRVYLVRRIRPIPAALGWLVGTRSFVFSHEIANRDPSIDRPAPVAL